MDTQSRSGYIPWLAFFFSLMGLAWCGYVAFPTASPSSCLSSGCELFRDAKLYGVSLWWVGGGYFFILSLVCLRGWHRFAWALAKLALALDTILLLIMFFSAPCQDCLVVALFFGLTLIALRPPAGVMFQGNSKTRWVLFPIWLGLLLGNFALVLNERLPLWDMAHQENKSIQIFFAPSCPACRDALTSLGGSAALYPVLEKPEDLRSIVIMRHLLSQNVPLGEALERSRDNREVMPELSLWEEALMQIALTRNRAAVLKQGFTYLPLIQINGMPKNWLPKNSGNSRGTSQSRPTGSLTHGEDSFLWDDGELGQCGQNTDILCPD